MLDVLKQSRGLAPIIIVALIALAAAAAGGWYLWGRGDDSASPAAVENGTVAGEGEFDGTYADAIASGRPLQCRWRVPDEFAETQIAEGELYTDGVSRGRSNATYTVQGAEAKMSAIFTDEAVHMWNEMSGGMTIGFRLSREVMEASDDELTSEEREQGENLRARYNFDCQPWAVDESVFKLPEDITFRALN